MQIKGLRFREVKSRPYVGQPLTLQETETQVKLASARKKRKSNWLTEVNCPGTGMVPVFQVWLYLGALLRLLSISILCHLTPVLLFGFVLQKSLPQTRQSVFGYTSISLATPGERDPLPEFPTNVLRLTSPSLDQSPWPG